MFAPDDEVEVIAPDKEGIEAMLHNLEGRLVKEETNPRVLNEKQIECYRNCDVKINNSFQDILFKSYIAKKTGNTKPVVEAYRKLMSRYKQINPDMFTYGGAPIVDISVDVVLETFIILDHCKHFLQDPDKLYVAAQELESLAKKFHTPQYAACRAAVKEPERGKWYRRRN